MQIELIFQFKQLSKLNNPQGCSYYSIYDGHFNDIVANVLEQKLDKYILFHQQFPSKIEEAINDCKAKFY